MTEFGEAAEELQADRHLVHLLRHAAEATHADGHGYQPPQPVELQPTVAVSEPTPGAAVEWN